MYNEERKLAFINRGQIKKTQNKERGIREKERKERIDKMVIALFNASEQYEKQHNKDLCEFSIDEIKDIFKNALGKSNSATKNYLHSIRKYINWCEENGYKCYIPETTVRRRSGQIYVDNVHKFKERYVASPLHLASILDKCFEPETIESVHCVFRAFFWMAFMGIPLNDTTEIKTKDVSLIDRCIIYNDIRYKLYEESVPCFKVLCTADSFCMPRYPDKPKHPRKESPYLFRTIRTEKGNINTLRSSVRKHMELVIGKTYTYEDIVKSGIYYRFYEFELAGLAPDIDGYVNEKCKDSTARGRSLYSLLSQTKNNLIKDYETWKKAFIQK